MNFVCGALKQLKDIMKQIILFLLVFTSISAYAQVPQADLNGEYKFTNGRLDDAIGSSDLTQVGSALTFENNRAGGPSKAVNLNGDYLQRVNHSQFAITASYWVKTLTNDANKRVIIDQTERTTDAEDTDKTGWYTYLENGKIGVGGNFQWYHSNSSAAGATGYMGYQHLVSSASVDDDNWHHVAISMHARSYVWFNAQFGRQDRVIECTYVLYVDGVQQGSLAQRQNVGNAPSPAMRRFVNSADMAITIGDIRTGVSANQYEDTFDDFRYYTKILNASEVGLLASEAGCSGTSGVTAVTQDITIELDASGNASIVPADIDNGSSAVCDEPFTLSVDKSAFTCDDLGFNVVTLTATETFGTQAVSTATATVTVTYVPEVLTQDLTVQLDASGNGTITPADINNGSEAMGLCGASLSYSLDKATFTCADLGTNTVTLTSDDGNGNIGTATATVTVEDLIAPEIVTQTISVQVDANTGFVIVDAVQVDNGSTDNCVSGGLTMSLSKNRFTCADTGDNVVTLSVEDMQGNMSTADVTITVTSEINDEMITATNMATCPDGSSGSTISTGSSVVGFNYTLRNSETDAVVDGPYAGTGSALDFVTGNLAQTTTFNILAEKELTPTQSALDFDGANDYVNIGLDMRGITSQLTIAAWIKTSVSGVRQFIASKYVYPNGFSFFIETDGKVRLSGRNDLGNTFDSGYSTATVNDGEWHYVSATLNLSAGVVSVYIDGVIESTASAAANRNVLNVADFLIGSGAGGTDYFNGEMDQFTIWNSALSAADIQANMTTCLTGSETGIVGHYIFEDGSGTTLSDQSMTGNGTLTNMDGATDWVDIVSVSCGERPCDYQLSADIIIGDAIAPTAIAQDISAQIDANTGTVIITADMVDNGSSDNCSSVLTKSLSKSIFECEDAGDQIITLTIEDESGNISTAQSTVTIISPILDETVTTSSTEFCPDGSIATISTGSSVLGIDYYLRNSANNEIEDGPIAGTGGALDFSTGNISSTTTFNVYGQTPAPSNSALDFDGSNDKVGTTYVPTATTELTIEGWIYPRSTNLDRIFSNYNGSGALSDGDIFIDTHDPSASNGRALRFNGVGAGGARLAFSVPNILTLNAWNHIAFTFDNGNVKIYLDGQQVGASTAPFTSFPNTSFPVYLGEDGGGSASNYFNGQMDEFRIWNTVRTENEILANKDQCLTGMEPGLEAYFNFDEATGTVVTDLVNAANGTLINMNAATDWVTSDAGITCGTVCGLQMTTEITIGDITAPTAVAQDITIQLDATGNATALASAVNNASSDNCTAAASLVLSLDQDTFTCADIGENTVSLTVTDAGGNEAMATATITVEDTVSPTVDVQNVTLQLDVNGNVSITAAEIDNGSSDNCTAVENLVLSLDKSDFTCADVGENTVTLTVTDASGNESSSMALVTIEDVTAPTAVAQGIVAELDENGTVTIAPSLLNNGSSDLCSETLSFSLDSSTFTCADLGANTVTLTVTDESGNESTVGATITVEDNLAPAIASQAISVQLDATGSATVDASTLNVSSSDNCSSTLMFELSQSDFDCSHLGENTVLFSVTDENGNTASQDVIITITDNGPSVVTQDITVELDANGMASIVATDINNESSDDCTLAGDLLLSLDVVDFTCEDLGSNTVTLTIEDENGNISTETATVTVTELIAPTVVAQDIVVVLDANGNASISPADIDNGSSDNCTAASGLSLSLDITTFDANNLGENTVVLTVTDASGNSGTAMATVTVSDKEAQAVTVAGVEGKTFGDEDFTITASVDSSLPLTFSVLSGGLSVDNQDGITATFTITGAGQATVQVQNDGDATYAPLQETFNIDIAKANQTITVEPISDKSEVAEPFNVNATVDSNLTLEYAVSGPATISGNLITLDGTLGMVTVTVSQPGNDDYHQISTTTTFEVVEKQSQTIAFMELPELTYGAGNQILTAIASSELPVSFHLVSGPATLSEGVLSITGAGTIVVEVKQEGNENFLEASIQESIIVAQAALTITANNQTISYGEAIPALTYSFDGFVNGDGEGDLNASIVIGTTAGGEQGEANAGTYPIIMTISPSEAGDNYSFTAEDATLTINKIDQVITLETIADKEPTQADFDVSASVDSGLDLFYEVSGPASISGTTITLDGAEGTVTVTVSQRGDVNHNAASESTTFNVALALGVGDRLGDQLKIYPNPVADYVVIDANERVNLRFFGLNGQLVKAIEQVNGRIDLSEIKRGTYLLEVSNKEERVTVRIHKAN